MDATSVLNTPVPDLSRFNWKLSDFQHRLGIDLRSQTILGLIRNLMLCFREAEDGEMVPYISVFFLDDWGRESYIDFEPEEVGLLDLHPDFCITPEDLSNHLEGFRRDLDFYEELLGADDKDCIAKRRRYEEFKGDIKAIMCANHFFTLFAFENLMAQDFLKGLA